MRSIIEIYLNGCWLEAAEFDTTRGQHYAATFEYKMEYVFGEHPVPVSYALPVSAERHGLDENGAPPPCPAFLLDLVPQGRGRQYLAHELKIDEGAHNDMLLAQYGAFNPVGNLRLNTALAFYQQHAHGNQASQDGFSLADITQRREQFLEHIWLHSMLTAGTTGVQGAAPKFLLTQDAQQRWFADAALSDELAHRHWLIKLPRGNHETDYTILRNEAAYLRVAARCGIRVHGEPALHNDMLFVARFDRQVSSTGLQRLHQESLASLAGVRGFGIPVSLFNLVAAFRPHVTDSVTEIIEFIKRDILNMAMRNTDNHARNTAIQRLPNGRVQLTPLFDFAPMYMDREFIVRGCKWRVNNGVELEAWQDIIANIGVSPDEMHVIAGALKMFQVKIGNLPGIMRDCGVDSHIIEDCKISIATQLNRLEQLALAA